MTSNCWSGWSRLQGSLFACCRCCCQDGTAKKKQSRYREGHYTRLGNKRGPRNGSSGQPTRQSGETAWGNDRSSEYGTFADEERGWWKRIGHSQNSTEVEFAFDANDRRHRSSKSRKKATSHRRLSKWQLDFNVNVNGQRTHLTAVPGKGKVRTLLPKEKDFHEVARTGQLAEVEQMIKEKINVNCMDEKDRSALHLAAGQGHVEIVKTLLDNDANVDVADKFGMNALLWAAWFGQQKAMEALVNGGALVKCENKQGLTIVHCSASRGHVEVLKYIVDNLLEEDSMDSDDESGPALPGLGKVTGLFGAAASYVGLKERKEESASKTKLRPESSFMEQRGMGQEKDRTAAWITGTTQQSAMRKFSETTMRKLSSVALISNIRRVSVAPLHFVQEHVLSTGDSGRSSPLKEAKPKYRGEDSMMEKKSSFQGNKTPLHLAAENGRVEAMEYLIKAKCNTLARTSDGCTALHLAAKRGHMEMVNLLLESDLEIDIRNEEGMTALLFAAEEGHANVVELLLTHKANCNVKANEKRKEMAAVHLASQKNHSSVILVLSSFGADLDAKCQGGNTAVHLASVAGNIKVLHTLMSKGANVNVFNDKKRLPLHEATENNLNDVVEQLLIAGAWVNQVDKNGKTALMMAARAENVTITDMIIKAGRYFTKRKNENRPYIRGKEVLQFRKEATEEQRQMKPILWKLAMKQLSQNDATRLIFYWGFSTDQIQAVQTQYTGPKSWKEHTYRMLLIWLHGEEVNPMKGLYEGLVAIEKKSLAENIRKKGNQKFEGKDGCVLS